MALGQARTMPPKNAVAEAPIRPASSMHINAARLSVPGGVPNHRSGFDLSASFDAAHTVAVVAAKRAPWRRRAGRVFWLLFRWFAGFICPGGISTGARI